MRITFLGTSAADAYPEAFCRCANCRAARALGGHSLRKRSAALINDDLLIDLGPDIQTAAMAHGLDLTGVRYCLQTHAHADHLDPSHLLSRSPGYGVKGAPQLHLYGSGATVSALADSLARDTAPASLLDNEISERLNMVIHTIVAGQHFDVGPYEVWALPANHDPIIEPLLYVISRDGRSLLYGCDTAPLPKATWRMLKHTGVQLDLAVLDHTYGPLEQSSDHLCARDVVAHAQRMRDESMLANGARIVATHIAHEGNPPHPELVAYATSHGYEIAYDGLVIDVSLHEAGDPVSCPRHAHKEKRAMTDNIMALDHAWEQAIIDEDVATMRRLAADDMIYTHSNGIVDDKEAFVSHIVDGPLDFQTVAYEDVEVRQHNTMALLTCALHKTYAVKADGRQGELHFRATKVWIKEHGRWQLLANQSTRIPDKI